MLACVMRFSQPVTKNMQKGIREVQKCKKAAAARKAKKEVCMKMPEGNKIHDITGELSSNGMLPP